MAAIPSALMSDLGAQIGVCVDRLMQAGLSVQKLVENDATRYRIDGRRYQLEVTIEEGQYLAMTLEVNDKDGKTLIYDVDTGLYDLTQPRFRDLGPSVAADIVVALRALGEGRVRVGHPQGKLTLAVPDAEGIAILRRGRFLTRTTRGRSGEMSALDAELVALQDWDA